MKNTQPNEQILGITSAIGAYVLWGILPIYWKLVSSVPSQEILAHRIVWSFLFMVLILIVTRKIKTFRNELSQIVSKPIKIFGIIMSSVLISINWFTYIWAVNNNHVVETSLGYYINPLVSVVLGIIVFKEKLSFWQMVAFFLALIGVLNITFHFGAFPWVAITLAISFALYGLSKKTVNTGALTGLTLETLLISPFALAYLSLYAHSSGHGALSADNPLISGLIVGAGIVTAIPLILFASGAKRLPLSVIGFLQYIAPTLMLILGVFLYHEPFTHVHIISFSFIWIALTIFSLAKTKFFIQHEPVFYKKTALSRDKKSI